MDVDERIHEILEKLKAGKTRDEIALQYGMKNKASLDQFLRRRGFRWNEIRQTYVLGSVQSLPNRVRCIIQDFQSVTADAKQIAERMGFRDHILMADFMRQNGFVWSTEKHNYIPQKPEPLHSQVKSEDHGYGQFEPTINWAEFLPLLQFLNENRGRLYTLLDQTPPRALTIPRYGIGGGHTIKSVQIATLLEELIRSFNDERKISQREIFEVALIQFFYRYGYGKRIEQYLITD